MNKKLTFHINNMAYTISVDNNVQKELEKYTPINKDMDTKDLLVAYVRLAQNHSILLEEIQKISQKIPNIK